MKKYNILDISRFIIQKSTMLSKSITNLQLQEVLTIVKEDSLNILGATFFDNEPEEWSDLKIFPDVFIEFSSFGPLEIKLNLTNEEFKKILKTIQDDDQDFMIVRLIRYFSFLDILNRIQIKDDNLASTSVNKFEHKSITSNSARRVITSRFITSRTSLNRTSNSKSINSKSSRIIKRQILGC